MTTTPRALAFDLYGTLVDPIRISRQLDVFIPQQALRVAEIWRQKQLEWSFRLTVMERYRDFEAVTRLALQYALDATGHTLTATQQQGLMEKYDALERFPDVEDGLRRLQGAGFGMMIFSNGTPKMIEAVMDHAQLRPFFSGFVSVDEIGVYKPSPRAYQHAAHRLGHAIGEVCLISSNPFDVIGAQSAGMQAAWMDRSGGLFEPLGPLPAIVVKTLTDLAARLGSPGVA
ncbi:MAG: haloacid dehalogenase type II [Herpetosiphon sp.]